ncbi:AMP-dependent synthetase/ligase [Paractinoplanes atraurantiacus]|uniref:Long-chain acyl-CoA synthetase n=1 Tax=Paractinoplanes atraurantiacus TaxID=1036182 RepID=A0A285K7S7_9ACTN|nr:long-chain fatty acid--CoA ligase [Actinoplanes atraurantiacus]SNY68598.1 long-chain acyl-CoA synthetase [Actinoplanes atraurantiacus]
MSTAQRAQPDEIATWERIQQETPASVGALLLDRVARTPDAEAYKWPAGGRWESQTWAAVGEIATEIAAGLLALGLKPEDRVSIMSGTRVEWIHADLGIMCAGGATTTIYPTSSAEDVKHILADSHSHIAIIESGEHLPKVLSPGTLVEHVILIDGPVTAGESRAMTLDGLRARGRELLADRPDAVTQATAAVTADHLATLIYTSGTTGRPKGVRLPHSRWTYEAATAKAIALIEPDDLGYLWLPMAHSFGKVLLAAQLSIGYPTAVDGDLTKIIENLPVVRPTVMPAVPRIFEKVHAGVVAAVHREGGLKARLFDWAIGVGRRAVRARRRGETPGALLTRQYALADRIVLSKVRARFGGRMRYFISGAAPLSSDIAEFFDAIGLPILEGYGLTESAAGSTINRSHHLEYGTVGLPLPGTEISIAADGEILIKGPGVMQGYHGLPDASATMLQDGWLHTGDIGEITARGNIKITDRKKDLIKTSGGKYVAPQSLETRFAALCPLSARIVVHGDGRQYITALIDLDPDATRAWAAEHGVPGATHADIVRHPKTVAAIDGYVTQLNAELGKWETIKRFTILERNLTVENGDLTPSLKLRRRYVEHHNAHLLDKLYID